MITVISICYIGCVVIAFKVIKIKPAPVSIAVATLIGVFILGGVLIGWKFSAPMTGQMVVKRNVIQLLAGQDSKELITKIHVPQEQMVKKGEVLYEVDPRPNQYVVDQLTAQLAVSRENLSQLQAGVEVAAATVEKAQADQAYSKAQLDTAEGIHKDNPAAIAALKVTVQEETYKSAQAAVEQSIASEKEAQFALASAKEAIKATEAQLSTAQLNLAQCVTKAPADGYIMNWQAVEGTMTTTVITSAQGTFMDMSETVVAAVFPQNLLKNVKKGDTVEIAFKSLPGQIAAGKIDAVLEYTGEGQLTPEATLPVAADVGSKGFLVVRILLDDEELAKELPLGGAGTTAIYTQVGKPFHVISKITVRIKSWMYYAPI
jgi:membrane fusion protein (multidrug efflux system)